MQVGSAYPYMVHLEDDSRYLQFLYMHICNDEAAETKIKIKITVSKFKSKVQT